MGVTMTMHQHVTSVRTHVWNASILYVFDGSIRQAKGRARWYPLVRGPDVADMLTTLNPEAARPVIKAASLVWMDDTPYLFPGSLATASGPGRGKAWKGERRKNEAIALYHRRLEAAGFEEQYGVKIGEG